MTIRKITVSRHGKAVPGPENMTHEQDLARMLSMEGAHQIEERHKALGNPTFDLTLSSPAERCVRSANLYSPKATKMQHVEELCYEGNDTTFGKALSAMFAELGNNSFAKYDKLDDEGLLGAHGERAWAKCAALTEEHNALHTLVVGHSPLIAAMGYAATHGASETWQSAFEDIVFSEAQGYTLTLDSGEIVGVEFHQ